MATYEILFRNGATVILNNVNITLTSENREVTELNFKRSPAGDSVQFMDIGEIISVVKRATHVPPDMPVPVVTPQPVIVSPVKRNWVLNWLNPVK